MVRKLRFDFAFLQTEDLADAGARIKTDRFHKRRGLIWVWCRI